MESNTTKFNPEVERSVEYGKNVDIILKFIRHGERDLDGNLLDLGREITKQKAVESGLDKEDFDAVKAIGSPAGPSGEAGMQRSLETAHIYANTIAGDEAFNTRVNNALSYETLVSPAPYNHREIYDANIPENFDSLDDAQKVEASRIANKAAVDYLVHLDTPEAIAYKQEIAGAYAYVIDHYMQVAKRLNPDSKVLLPAGTHGGLMEFILQQALVREDEEGKKTNGFNDLDEIGDNFNPSEAFDVDISTDEQGNIRPLNVSFDNPDRPTYPIQYLDMDRVQALKNYYEDLHSLKNEA